MSHLLWLARFLAPCILVVLIAAGLVLLLVANGISSKLYSDAFYLQALENQDGYNRLYSHTALDLERQEPTPKFFGDHGLVGTKDMAQLTREVMPPDYLRAEIDRNIRAFVAYLSEEDLKLYWDFSVPLARTEPTLLAYTDSRVEEAVAANTDPVLEVTRLGGKVVKSSRKALVDEVVDPIGTSVPGVAHVTRELSGAYARSLEEDEVFDLPVEGALIFPSLGPEVWQGLEGNGDHRRAALVSGDSGIFSEQAARATVIPVMDGETVGLRSSLDERQRLDLIKLLAQNSGSLTERRLRAEAASARDRLGKCPYGSPYRGAHRAGGRDDSRGPYFLAQLDQNAARAGHSAGVGGGAGLHNRQSG